MATPTYKELSAMLNSADFLDRATFAVATYARYILNEDPATAFHKSRSAWAKDALLNPRGIASQLGPAIALDGVFASQNPLNLTGTPDTGAGSMQVAVEATINSTLLAF